MKTPSVAAGAVLVALVTGLTACGTGSGSQNGHVARQPDTAGAQAAPAPVTLPKAPDAVLPKVAPAPAIATAQAALAKARGELDAAAATVFAAGSDASLTPSMTVFSRDIAFVQEKSDLAYTTGQAGNCAGSFSASRAADAGLAPTKKDLAAIGQAVSKVTHARSHYSAARQHALVALEQLYNAIAGHPLATGPSSDVDGMRQAIAYDDHATSDITRQASAIVVAAHKTADSARQAVKQAALSPCLEVSA